MKSQNELQNTYTEPMSKLAQQITAMPTNTEPIRKTTAPANSLSELTKAKNAAHQRVIKLTNRYERLTRRKSRAERQLFEAHRDYQYHDARHAMKTKLTVIKRKKARKSASISPKEIETVLGLEISKVLDMLSAEKRAEVMKIFNARK